MILICFNLNSQDKIIYKKIIKTNNFDLFSYNSYIYYDSNDFPILHKKINYGISDILLPYIRSTNEKYNYLNSVITIDNSLKGDGNYKKIFLKNGEIEYIEETLISGKTFKLKYNNDGYLNEVDTSLKGLMNLYDLGTNFNYYYEFNDKLTYNNKKQIIKVIKKKSENNFLIYNFNYDDKRRIKLISVDRSYNSQFVYEFKEYKRYYFYFDNVLLVLIKTNLNPDSFSYIDYKVFDKYGYIKKVYNINNFKTDESDYDKIKIDLEKKLNKKKLIKKLIRIYKYKDVNNENKDNLMIQFNLLDDEEYREYFLDIINYFRFEYLKKSQTAANETVGNVN